MTTLYRPIIPNRDLERERALSKPSDVIAYKASTELASELIAKMEIKHSQYMSNSKPIMPGHSMRGRRRS